MMPCISHPPPDPSLNGAPLPYMGNPPGSGNDLPEVDSFKFGRLVENISDCCG